MYDEILICTVLQIFLSSSIVTFFSYFIISKYITYEVKNRLHIELYILKNILPDNVKKN